MTEPESEAARARLVHGGDPLPERVQVCAGPLTLVLEAGDVRHVHLDGREVVRRIYGAVRDHAWHTIPARLSGLAIESRADRFACRYRAEHRLGEVAFTWEAAIDGAADGTLTFAFDGVAEATFRRNRIGLCLLHPLPALAGARARVTTSAGAMRPLHLPDLVAIPQPVDGFDDVARLAIEVAPDVWVEAAFEGDVFQVEDQRAWIDASTKAYGTPVSLPKPVTVERGTRIRQRIVLRLLGEDRAVGAGAAPFVIDRVSGELRFGDGARGHLPRIGVPPALAQAPLRPAHVRVDLDLAGAGARPTLAGPEGAASIALELALHLPADGAAAGRALDRVVLTGMPVARVLAFTHGHDTTQAATLDAVRTWRDRQRDHVGVPIATGTPGDLARIHVAGAFPAADAVCWAMDPQAHATDLTSIAETPAGARDQAITMARRYPGLPAAITATFGRHGRPDRRARSLFTAAWTLAILGALGEAGAASVTLADAGDDGTPPGALGALPLAHVLAALSVCPGAPIRPVAASLDTVYACALETGAGRTLLLANLAPRACELALPDDRPWTMWLLDADTPFASLTAPLGLVDPALTTVASRRVALGPCAIARLDAPA